MRGMTMKGRSLLARRTLMVPLLTGLFVVAGCDNGPTGPESQAQGPDSDSATFLDGEGADFQGMVASLPGFSANDMVGDPTLEQMAQRWVEHATRLFERAQSLAGPNPEPPVSAWLQAAGQMLSQAQASLAAGNYQAAIAQAQASADKSHKVIDALSESPDAPELEERAAVAIDLARTLLDEAWALAGNDPSERVAAALARSEELLGRAKAAFNEGDFVTAIRLARSSAGLSQAVIRYLNS
jgi:hypothetical protein